MKRLYELTKEGRESVNNFIAELTAKRKEILDAGKDTVTFSLPTVDDIIQEIESDYGLDEYSGWWASTDNDDPLPLCLKYGSDFVKVGVQELALPVQTKYGEGKVIASVDRETGQISITYQTPETGDIIDLVLVEARDKKNSPAAPDNETTSFAIRVFADPYTEDYSNSFDVNVNEIQESVTEPAEIPDSMKI